VLLRTQFSNGRFAAAGAAALSFAEWAKRQTGVDDATELAHLLAEGYCVAGAIHHRAGELTLARNRYLKAIEHRRDFALALNNLAVLTLSEPAGRTAAGVREALLLAERAVEVMPGAADFQDTLGFALAAAGRHAEATRAYVEAVRLFSGRIEAPDTPHRVEARQSMARTLVRLSMSRRVMGDRDAAAAALREATAADPAVVGEALYLEAAQGGKPQ
jgi:tetratricopeptide (TPR) repeat protein